MPLANIALTNTFDEWRIRTNQLVYEVNDIQSNVALRFISNNSVLNITPTQSLKGNVYIGLAISTNISDTATNNIASANSVNAVLNFAILGSTTANTYANNVGIRANTWANGVGVSANSWSNSVGISANSWANGVGVSANSWANSVGVSANSWSNSVGISANSWSNSVGISANTYASNVGISANTYASNVGISANTYASNVGISANSWSNSVGISANSWSNSVGISANTYANNVGIRANTWANSVGISANSWANSVGISANSWANSVGISANTYASNVGISANSWANSVGISANTYASNVGISANSWANTISALAFDKANAANLLAFTANNTANTANVTATEALRVASLAVANNTSALAMYVAQSAFDFANTVNVIAVFASNSSNAAFIQANTARSHANAAFGVANNALPNSTVTLAGSLESTGYLNATSGFYSTAVGTPTRPSISWKNDIHTGLSRPAANTIAISTAASGRMYIDSNGYVGIGTSSPSRLFDVTGNTNQVFTGLGSISGNVLTITSVISGQINVGHYISDESLSILGGTYVKEFWSGTGGLGTYNITSSQTLSSTLVYGYNLNNSSIRLTSSDASINIGQPIGMIEFASDDADLTADERARAFIYAVNEQVDAGATLMFGTASGSLEAQERLRINRFGAVGLGGRNFGTAGQVLASNGSTNSVEWINNPGIGANAFASATIAGANTAVGAGANSFASATIAGANTAVGAGANAYANLVWSRSNTYADTVGTAANNFMIAVQNGSNTAVGLGANSWANSVGTSANAFASATIAGANTAVGLGANSWANSVGVSANAFASATIAGANTAVGAGANAYANLVWSRSNTYADTVGTSANAFASATIAGANTAVGLGANSWANSVGTSANAFASATIAGANSIAIAAFSKANSTTYTSNLVISVADSLNAALRITQTGTADAIRVEDEANPDASPFVVDATGNVLVGRTTSTVGNNVKLDVNGAINASSVLVNGQSIVPIGKQTIWVPATAMTPRVTNGAVAGSVETTTNRIMAQTLDFDATTQEFSQFAVQMPKGWNEGTLIGQFVWSHANTITNYGVVWGIQAVAFANNDILDAAFGANTSVLSTGGTNNSIYISPEAPAFTVAGSPGPEEYVVFQVFRNAANTSDTMAIDARLHGVKIHYTTDAARDD